MNPQKRKELLENASKIITEDAPIAPIYSYTSAFLKKPYVVGFQKNSMDKYSLKGVYLEERKIN